jgi:alpha-amylase
MRHHVPARTLRARRNVESLAERARRFGVALVVLLGSACGGSEPDLSNPVGPVTPVERPTLSPVYRASGYAAAGDVFVHLFEWSWNDISSECTNVLGPAGVRGVQVSPPQEHIVFGSRPWWERYQPVSYSIDKSRSGTRAEFMQMVSRCRTAGVEIYVDAVINHMTAGGGTGTNGTAYTKYAYPGLWTTADFHSPCGVSDYQSAANVQDCELVGLADLRTGLATVQQKLAEYLLSLVRLGVAGFRIDAAKHMQPAELDAIVSRTLQGAAAEALPRPWFFGEVIDYGGEAVKVRDYFGVGYAAGGATDLTEFKYRGISDKFLRVNGQRLGELAQFSERSWGVIPSDKAVVFVENHDTQRDRGVWYRDGVVLRLAYVWLLGHPYGYPSIMSGYGFDRTTLAGRDHGPPLDGNGVSMLGACPTAFENATVGQRTCEHRDPTVLRMVRFRRQTAGSDVRLLWDNGGNAVAFSRGTVGFVAINRESVSVTASVPSALAAGEYCDELTGGKVGTACAGTTVTVNATGAVQLSLGANSAVVLHTGGRR